MRKKSADAKLELDGAVSAWAEFNKLELDPAFPARSLDVGGGAKIPEEGADRRKNNNNQQVGANVLRMPQKKGET